MRYLSPDNETIFVQYYLSSRPEVKKVILETPVLKCLFNKIAGLRPVTLLQRDSSKGAFSCILRDFLEHLICT